MNLDEAFDRAVFQALHFLLKGYGLKLYEMYDKDAQLKRFTKFGVSLFIEFWLLRAPLEWAMVNLAGWHYLVSSFLSGLILAIVGFFLNDGWIWRKKE